MASPNSKLRILIALLAFRLMVGFIVAVWISYSILSAHPGRPFAEAAPVTVAGALLIAAGLIGYIRCAWDFAMIGLSFGPPLLVARGIYGMVRHPMYFSLTLILFGERSFLQVLDGVGICVCALADDAPICDALRRTPYGEKVGTRL
jgi:protein-S-isoprenylcysteine O-methyltransferase Ste14